VLVSSHEVERVAPIAGRTVTIAGGRIRAEARPDAPAPPPLAPPPPEVARVP
jgi:hypothetical protein